jgi:hypothetical protein
MVPAAARLNVSRGVLLVSRRHPPLAVIIQCTFIVRSNRIRVGEIGMVLKYVYQCVRVFERGSGISIMVGTQALQKEGCVDSVRPPIRRIVCFVACANLESSLLWKDSRTTEKDSPQGIPGVEEGFVSGVAPSGEFRFFRDLARFDCVGRCLVGIEIATVTDTFLVGGCGYGSRDSMRPRCALFLPHQESDPLLLATVA